MKSRVHVDILNVDAFLAHTHLSCLFVVVLCILQGLCTIHSSPQKLVCHSDMENQQLNRSHQIQCLCMGCGCLGDDMVPSISIPLLVPLCAKPCTNLDGHLLPIKKTLSGLLMEHKMVGCPSSGQLMEVHNQEKSSLSDTYAFSPLFKSRVNNK